MGLKAVDSEQDLGGRPRRLAGVEAVSATAAFLDWFMAIIGDTVSIVVIVVLFA